MVLLQLNFIELDRYGTEFQSYNYNESLYGWKQKTYAIDFFKVSFVVGYFYMVCRYICCDWYDKKLKGQ